MSPKLSRSISLSLKRYRQCSGFQPRPPTSISLISSLFFIACFSSDLFSPFLVPFDVLLLSFRSVFLLLWGFLPFCSLQGLFHAADNGCCQLVSPSIIISLSLLPASITETIHVPFLLLQALGFIPFACSLPYLTHASFFALAHAGGSSSCCGCVVMQILKIKTAVNNILQTLPSSLVLEPQMYVFCVWVGGGAQNGGELKSHRSAQVRVFRSRG